MDVPVWRSLAALASMVAASSGCAWGSRFDVFVFGDAGVDKAEPPVDMDGQPELPAPDRPHDTDPASGGAPGGTAGAICCAECCSCRKPRLTEDWMADDQDFSARWLRLGTGSRPRRAGGRLYGFDPNLALFRDGCLSLAMGARLTFDLEIAGGLQDRLTIAFIRSPGPSGPTVSPFSLVFQGDGVMEARRNNIPYGPRPRVPTGTARVTLELKPSNAHPDNTLRAHVQIGEGGPYEYPQAIRTADLEHGLRCRSGGLLLSVSGVGDGVRLGHLDVAEGRCWNPASFEPLQGHGLTSTDFGEWAKGGVGSPAVAVLGRSDAQQWHLFVDAARAPRANPVAPPRFSIGQAHGNYQTGQDGPEWISPSPDVAVPCMGDGNQTTRDPTAVVESDGKVTLVFATSSDGQSFQIKRHQLVIGDPSAHCTLQASELLPGTNADAVRECDSFSGPALVKRHADQGEDVPYLMFFTCHRLAGPAIRVVGLTSLFTIRKLPWWPGEAPFVLLPGDVPGFGAQGVFGPEVLAEPMRQGSYRMWFMATGNDGLRTIGLARGTEGTPNDPPRFNPESVNPVLSGAALGDPETMIEGFSVTPFDALQERMLFLVAHWRGGSPVPSRIDALSHWWPTP